MSSIYSNKRVSLPTPKCMQREDNAYRNSSTGRFLATHQIICHTLRKKNDSYESYHISRWIYIKPSMQEWKKWHTIRLSNMYFLALWQYQSTTWSTLSRLKDLKLQDYRVQVCTDICDRQRMFPPFSQPPGCWHFCGNVFETIGWNSLQILKFHRGSIRTRKCIGLNQRSEYALSIYCSANPWATMPTK